MIAMVLVGIAVLGDPQPLAPYGDESAPRTKASESSRGAVADAANRKQAALAVIERTGLAADPRRCRRLIARLDDADAETRSVAARSLGWCGTTDAVDPLIASLGRDGWSEAAEAALHRLDPSWRTRAAARRTFDQVHGRWWDAVRSAAAAQGAESAAMTGEGAEAEFRDSRLLVRLDPARGREALLQRLALPAGRYGCSLWAVDDEVDEAFAAQLEAALTNAPDRACLEEAVGILERFRPGWNTSGPARVAADSYAERVATGPESAAKDACGALALLGDDRARKCDVGDAEDGGDGCDATNRRARGGDRSAIVELKDCAFGADPSRSSDCVEALAGLGRADLVDTYRVILAEPRAVSPADRPHAAPPAERPGSGEPDGGAESAGPDKTPSADKDEDSGPDMRGYYRAQRRAAAVAGLNAALGPAALAELKALVADGGEPEEVLSAIVAAAKSHSGPEWTDLLLRIGSQKDGGRAPGEAIATLLDHKSIEALTLLWTGLQEGSFEPWQPEDLIETAARLFPQQTAERLRAMAEDDPDFYPALATALLEPSTAASAEDLVALLPQLVPVPDVTSRSARDNAASKPTPAEADSADSEGRRAATAVLRRVADGPLLDRSHAPSVARFLDDSDPQVRALAAFILWRVKRGH